MSAHIPAVVLGMMDHEYSHGRIDKERLPFREYVALWFVMVLDCAQKDKIGTDSAHM